ncbi:MAG TPA: hypothetical protein EYQ85_06370 [Candidatus Poseidoniales archaeon]|jgi:transcription initiation factor TFIIIB Brf1 subunit/transcription initiation factor TFIIB|nr:MAG: hypothetical protein CXT68_00505 [Euryarchaeota archaeon]HIF16859.1 hypothetical protein [Candidatus Poseidoniales archaeon]
MENKCSECSSILVEDGINGEYVCKKCGLVYNESALDMQDKSSVFGDASHSQVGGRSRMAESAMEGTTFNPREKGIDKAFWSRMNRYQTRTRRGRECFADKVMEHVRSLCLGSDVESAARAVVEATLIAQHDEAEKRLGNLPLNELRVIQEKTRIEREQTAAIAAIITASSMGLISPCRITSLTQGWNIEKEHYNELAKRMKQRITRMRGLGRISFVPPQRPSMARKASINDAISLIRQELQEEAGLANQVVKDIISGCLRVLTNFGEPEVDSSLPNERPDMLVAVIAKQVMNDLGVRGHNRRIATALGLSPGGVSQRFRDLKELLELLS